jgi:uncharacterized protein (DUF433 family)
MTIPTASRTAEYTGSEILMAKEYIHQRDGGYFIAGSRVSLDSVVCEYLRGESPEAIAEAFPALSLEQVFGALAFYLANRESVDRQLLEARREFESLRQRSRRDHPALHAKIAGVRAQMQITRA